MKWILLAAAIIIGAGFIIYKLKNSKLNYNALVLLSIKYTLIDVLTDIEELKGNIEHLKAISTGNADVDIYGRSIVKQYEELKIENIIKDIDSLLELRRRS